MSQTTNRHSTGHSRHGAIYIVLCFLLLFMPIIFAQSPTNRSISPSIPKADRYQKNKIFLEYADRLSLTEGQNYQLLIGNVQFRKGDMFMYCDSAHFYEESNSLDAFGNVKMEQGDTLFVYADELDYDGITELAILYADVDKKVKLINNDVMLETDVFNYDLGINLGYYEVGGVLTDKQNRLTSIEGEYNPATKDANFYTKVHLNSISEADTLDMFTETLSYNTDTHIAELVSFTEIINNRGTIFAQSGIYNTSTNIAELYNRSTVITKDNNTLVGDTIYYDKNNGYGEAFGNMILTDSAHQSSVHGDYGFYNQLIDSAFVTGKAYAKEYSKKDTLYLHGQTIRTFISKDDTSRIMIVHPRVRFFRSDMQGICDSLSFTQRDSNLYMHYHPVIWSGKRQIFGNIIQIHFNDTTAEWAKLPDFGFAAEHIAEEFYNQLSGKEMIAYFSNGTLSHLDVSGNVQVKYLPMENDSTYNKIGSIESSSLAADFSNNQLEYMKCWTETPGNLVPLYIAQPKMYYLPQFKWYEILRPKNPADIFNIPPEMIELFKGTVGTTRRRKTQ